MLRRLTRFLLEVTGESSSPYKPCNTINEFYFTWLSQSILHWPCLIIDPPHHAGAVEKQSHARNQLRFHPLPCERCSTGNLSLNLTMLLNSDCLLWMMFLHGNVLYVRCWEREWSHRSGLFFPMRCMQGSALARWGVGAPSHFHFPCFDSPLAYSPFFVVY